MPEVRDNMTVTRHAPGLTRATEIAASGFTDALRQDVADHLNHGDLVYGIVSGTEYVGFCIFNVWEDILYLSGIIVEASYQGCSHVVQAVRYTQQDTPDVKYLALRTQSPRMWAAGAGVCSSWVPSPGLGTDTGKLDTIGHTVATHIQSSYPVGIGHYGGPLYGTKPIYRSTVIQAWWDSLCNFERGDAIICVGLLK